VGDVVGMLLFPCWMVGIHCRIIELCLPLLLIKPFLLMRKRLLDVFACKLN